MSGQKTSIYLTEEAAERVRASGLPLPELVRRGLDANAPPPLEDLIRRVVREELAAWAQGDAVALDPARSPGTCKHRNLRGVKGICPDCSEWAVKP